jgi:pyridoxine kinase
MKRAAAIHDLSGFGKCSLTVVLPILSAMGVEVCPLPTAVLSTHTALPGAVVRDLTEDLRPIAAHWQALGIAFDAVYTGFAASKAQLEIIREIAADMAPKAAWILVDPVLGDHGTLYRTYTADMVGAMRRLCRAANVITPNLTEAAFLLDKPYDPAPLGEAGLLSLCRALHDLGPQNVVITGVALPGERLGAAAYDARTDDLALHAMPKAPGIWHGTGDIFSAVLLGALLNGHPLGEAARQAVQFTQSCIVRTWARGGNPLYGVDVEASLRDLFLL